MATMQAQRLQLTSAEASLRDLLLHVAKYINPDQPTDLRFTGGWVRDKLMGIQSHDIDVGINDMTGYQYGLKMKEYLAIPGNETKYGVKGIAANLHKIEANPEKSKHLETVTTKIFGLDVDLVNLRKETYSDESRNPQMEFGTPQEDALRRDATVNAMFYNLRTQSVEDFTGQGHNDMQDHVIRTPLEPYQTFKDDPLRVLRLIRFASRFDYAIDPAAEKAMGDKDIKQALRVKISRERVGVEIEKMLKGPRPHMGLALIDRLGLYDTIFVDPEHETEFQPEIDNWRVAYDTAAVLHTYSTTDLRELFEGISEQSYLVWILSATVPWADAPLPALVKPGSKPPPPMAFEVIRNGLKASMKICDIVRESVTNAEDIVRVKDACIRHLKISGKAAEPGTPASRDTLGMAIRKWGQSWKSQVAFAAMLEAVRATGSERDVLAEYVKLVKHITGLNLLDAPSLKPVIDGKSLAKELGTRPGPWMKTALEEVMAWQLCHPDDATPEAAVEALRSKHGELPSRLIVHFLTLTIRPLFSQTKTQSQKGMTSQGRQLFNSQSTAMPSRSRDEVESPEEAAQRRPWKQDKHADSLQLLSWCITALQAEQSRTEQNWPLVIPPILALVDDVEVRFKAHGCQLLLGLLQATSASLLAKTGLGQVFQDAVTPCLSYLPTLTAEQESIMMLDAAYPVVLYLPNVRHPKALDSRENGNLRQRERMLSHVLHHHLLRSLFHIEPQDYPKLTICLLRYLSTLCDELGIGTIAQLKHILPAVMSVLACELGRYAPDMLATAARCLQHVIGQAWPRIWRWRGDVMKGVCLAWLEIVKGEDSAELSGGYDAAREELRNVVKMLSSSIVATRDVDSESNVDFAAETNLLVEADPKLDGLFDA